MQATAAGVTQRDRLTRRTAPTIRHLAELAFVGALAVALLVGAANTGPASPADMDSVTIITPAGASAWELAALYPVPGLDTAETAELILEMNGLTTGGLTAGQCIAVPAPGLSGQVAQR